jgi:hypothetical protein
MADAVSQSAEEFPSKAWSARRFPWAAAIVIVCMSLMFMWLAMSMFFAVPAQSFNMLAGLGIATFSLVLLCSFFAATWKIRSGVDGLQRIPLLGRGRSVTAADIAGVCPSQTRRDGTGTVHVMLRSSARPWKLVVPPYVALHGDLQRGLLDIYGPCTVSPTLMPSESVFAAAERHLAEHGEFRWRPRFGWLFSSLGIKSLAWLVSLPFGTQTIEQWVRQNNASMWSLLAVILAGGVCAALGGSVLLELARGGSVVELRATAEGITVQRWWRSTLLPADSIASLWVKSDDLGISALIVLRDADMRPRGRVAPWRWRGPLNGDPADEKIGMIAPLLMLYGTEHRGVRGQPDGAEVLQQVSRSDPVN